MPKRAGFALTPTCANLFSAQTNSSMLIRKGGSMHVGYTPMRRMLSRRDFFGRIGSGLSGIALGSLLAEANDAGMDMQYDVLPKKPHFAPKARRVIMLFQNGGPSHVDPFHPKVGVTPPQGQK